MRLFTRSGQDWTERFSRVARAVARLPVKSAWLDGEVAVVLPDGTTSFQALQNYGQVDAEGTARGGGGQLAYFVFDLLFRDGEDLRGAPLEARKRMLAGVVAGADQVLRYVDHVDTDGRRFFAEACRAGLEGIVSKRRDRPHVPGRGGDWVKTKCVKRQELVIGGFTEPRGARKGIGALLVGFHRDGQLRYAGKVGTGYTEAVALDLRRRLDRLIRETSPFAPPARSTPRATHWVAPTLLAEVGFAQITTDGKLRHPVFQGLREDKAAAAVVREAALPLSQVILAPPPRAQGKKKADQAVGAPRPRPRKRAADR